MVEDDLLTSFPKSQVRMFARDLAELARVMYSLDKYYGMGESETKQYVSDMKKVLRRFSKKYEGLTLSLSQKSDGLDLNVFVHEERVYTFFADVASKIKGLKSIGLKHFDEVELSDSSQFSRVVSAIKNSVYLTFTNSQNGTSTLACVYDKKRKKVKVLLNVLDVRYTNSADFRVLAYYALKSGYDASIDVHEDLCRFGFITVLKPMDKNEWFKDMRFKHLEA